ncbi:MAG: ATP-binding protein [Nitrospirota bacterium]
MPIINGLSKPEIKGLVRANMLFQNLSPEECFDDNAINEAVELIDISYRKTGETVFEAGSIGDTIILVLEGEVDVIVIANDGVELKIATVESNCFFGDMAIIENSPRAATMRTRTDCILGSIRKKTFWDFYYKYPLIGKNLMWGINQRMKHANIQVVKQLIQEKDKLLLFSKELEKQVEEKTKMLRKVDMQLIEMDRIAGMGTLAAGISHEINNPLSFLKSGVVFIEKQFAKLTEAAVYWENHPFSQTTVDEYAKYIDGLNINSMNDSINKKFDMIQRGITRISKIVNSMRSITCLDMAQSGTIDINKSIEEVLEILSTKDSKSIQFIKELNQLPLIDCITKEINQALLHILTNAVDAIRHTGIINIKTSYDDETKTITVHISDNGVGMSPDVLKRVFDPFFTTKDVGAGTGIGLSITEGIIKRHNGKINITSAVGEGTTVVLQFPMIK